jgi:hypothetical protein
MKKILLIFNIIIDVNILYADIAPNPIFINGVIPSSPCKIQMVSETVKAFVYKDSSFVECVFLLKNCSGRTKLNVGFPIMSFYHWMPSENWDPVSENFSVWVNNEMTTEYIRYIPEELLVKQRRLNYLDSLAMRDYLRVSDSLKAIYPICSRKEEINFYNKFDSLFHNVRNPKALIELRKDLEYLVDYSQTPWYLWDMAFDSLESKTVRIKYRVPSGSGYWSTYQYFKYILHTGSGWYKSIEKADITVKIMNFNIDKIDLTTPQNFIIDKKQKEIRWDLRDIEPTYSDNIYIQYSFGKNKFSYWYHKKLRFYLFKYFSPKYYIQRHQENKRYKEKCKKNTQANTDGIIHKLVTVFANHCFLPGYCPPRYPDTLTAYYTVLQPG